MLPPRSTPATDRRLRRARRRRRCRSTTCPTTAALVDVHWSSINYKDGLASTPTGKVARISPIVPGIDLAGVLVEDAPRHAGGTAVIAHGYDLGVARHGGFAQLARVPAAGSSLLPDGLTGSRGDGRRHRRFTAAMSVIALLDHGVSPSAGRCSSPARPAASGRRRSACSPGSAYEVVASTGKPASATSCSGLGATSIIDRAELAAESPRPLESTVWAGRGRLRRRA